MGFINRIIGKQEEPHAGRLTVPFDQIDFYKIAQKEQTLFVKDAASRRRKLRAQAFFFMLLLVSYLTYNAVSNLTTVQRNSQVQDVKTAADLQSEDPQYNAAKAAYDDNMALLNTLQAEYQSKVSMYTASDQKSRATHWIGKLEQVQKDKIAAQAEFSKVLDAVREESNAAVDAFGEDIFHKLFGVAIPILMLLVGIGVIKLPEYKLELMIAMYLIMLPNSFFIQQAIFHAFPYPSLDLPVIGKTSPAALFMLPVVFYVEPWATIVCLRMIIGYLDGWHDVLQEVMSDREQHRQERSNILEELLEVHMKVLQATAKANANASGLKAETAHREAQAEVKTVMAKSEVEAAADDAVLKAMVPKTTKPVGDGAASELAEMIMQMEADGRWEAFKAKGGSQKMVADLNGVPYESMKAAKSSLKQSKTGEGNE